MTDATGHSAGGSLDPTSEAVYWDIHDIQFHCRISRSTAWRLVRYDNFPPPVVLGKRSVLWPRDEVLGFMDNRRNPGHYRTETPRSTGADGATFSVRAVRQRPLR